MEELKEIKQQFDELMARAEEIVEKNEKGNKRWRAKKGEGYWLVGFVDGVLSDTEAGADADFERWKVGNYFKTEEEAKKVAQHFKDYLTLRADAKGYEPKDGSVAVDYYYYVFWDATDKCLKTYDYYDNLFGTIYFKTREDAEASIAKHGEIWKRYLGVSK